MRFEVGKFYRHTSGSAPFHVLTQVDNSTAYLNPLIAEDTEGVLHAIGRDEAATVNHIEMRPEDYYAVWYEANPDSKDLARLAAGGVAPKLRRRTATEGCAQPEEAP